MKKITLLVLSLLLSLYSVAVFANQNSATKDNKTELKKANKLEQNTKSKDTKDSKESKIDKKDKKTKEPKDSKIDKEPKPSNNSKTNQSNKTNTSKSNLNAYPQKMIGWYASMNIKNGCASYAAIYKKTKHWPGLEISTQQVINNAEKLVCKQQRIKAMDGNFYVAESCKNEKNSTISRHLIYAKNNNLLAVSSDNKLQTFTECDLPKGSK